MEFPEEQRQQWQRHVIACEKKHPEVIEALEEARTNNAFTSIYDKEQYRFLRERAVARGEI